MSCHDHPGGDKSELKWPAHLKKTKHRMLIMALLEDADIPLTAQQIFETLQADHPKIWLSTVYRSLDAFLSAGLIHRTTLLDHEISLYESANRPRKHYAICTQCHKLEPVRECPLKDYSKKTATGFQVRSHKLELYGLCQDCMNKEKNPFK